MRVVRAAAAVLALLVIPLAGAQDPVHETILYPTNEVIANGGACSINRDYVMSDLAPEPGRAYASCSLGGAGYYMYFSHTTTQDMVIDGPVQWDAVMGCDPATVFTGTPATTSFRTILHIGGENSGNINGNRDNLCTGTSTFSAAHDFGSMVVPAGTNIRIQFIVFAATPSGAERGVVYIGTGPDASVLRIAGSPPAAGPLSHQEELASPTVAHDFTNLTSDTYQFNFTTDLVNSTAHFAWNATTGSVNATLTDANGTVVFNGTLAGNGTLAHPISNATAGAWNLTLAYSAFNGTLAFELAPAAVDPVAGPDATNNGTVEANGTAALDSVPKDTPVPLVVPVLGLVAAVAVRRRR